MDAKKLEAMFGLTAEELEKSAAAYESGEWPEGKTVHLGRPPLYDGDELVNATFRIRKSQLIMIDEAASNVGASRSSFLRDAADEKLRRLAAV